MTRPGFDLLAAVAAADRRKRAQEARRAFALLAKFLLWPWK